MYIHSTDSIEYNLVCQDINIHGYCMQPHRCETLLISIRIMYIIVLLLFVKVKKQENVAIS